MAETSISRSSIRLTFGNGRRVVDDVGGGRHHRNLGAVGLISILAPDMVTGSEQQHMPIAAATSWLWGLLATIGFLWAMTRLRGRPSHRPIWIGLTTATLVLWLIATILSATLPDRRDGNRSHTPARRRHRRPTRGCRTHGPGRHHRRRVTRPQLSPGEQRCCSERHQEQ